MTTAPSTGSLGRRFAAAVVTALAVAVTVVGCASSQAASAMDTAGGTDVPVVVTDARSQLPATVTDSSGTTVTVTDTSRIVVLNGGIGETVVAMGQRDRIVGRDVSTDFPGIAEVPLVTHGHDVSAEGLLALNPSVVLADARSGPPEALAAVRQSGVPVVIVPEVWSLTDAPARVTAIAAALGMPDAGSALNTYLDGAVRTTRDSATTGDTKPTVAFLYVRGTAAVYLLGGKGSGADDMIAAAGGIDAGSKANLESFTPLTPEALAHAAPDVILVMDKGLESVGGVQGLVALPGVGQTPAGRNQRIVSLPDGELLSFGPRTPVTLARLAELIR